ncbi:hypothetical protein JXB31_05220 [Candidatus Woesearchaeota archaeon]|nr:hypothetical protein [Candidatus Woesearchaeota archaeon]
MTIAVDKIRPAFDMTYKAFFPINCRFWLKAGLVSFISSMRSLNPASSNNFNPKGFLDIPFRRIVDFIRRNLFLLGACTGFFAVIRLFIGFIGYIFSFIFFDFIIKNKTEIKKGFYKHTRKGRSAFLFSFVVGLLNLIVVVLLALPLLIPLFQNLHNLSLGLFDLKYLIFFVIFFVIDMVIFGLFGFIFKNIVLFDMYINETLAVKSFVRVIKLIRKETKEVVVFAIISFLLGIFTSVISFIVMVPFS